MSDLRRFWRTIIADELLTKKGKHKMEKIYDEDSRVAINKSKTSIALQESDLNLTKEIRCQLLLTFILKVHYYYGKQWWSKFDLHLNT